jgi:hypothetical protein
MERRHCPMADRELRYANRASACRGGGADAAGIRAARPFFDSQKIMRFAGSPAPGAMSEAPKMQQFQSVRHEKRII